MRNAKIAAAGAVVAALLFFMATSFRQAMSTSANTLFQREQSFDQLRANAEEHGDAKLLAYVALHERRPEIAQAAAEHAVALDPQLTWTYYVLAGRWNVPNRAEMIAKLQRWDPQNAAVYMVEASHMSGNIFLPASGEEPWIKPMARAFDAPKYDSYMQQHLDLEREIVLRRGIGNPQNLWRGLTSHPIGNMGFAHQYANLALNTSQQPREIGLQARRVATFGERLLAAETTSERLMGSAIALDAYKKLQPVAPAEEVGLIAVRIAYLESIRPASYWRSVSWWMLERAMESNAMTVEVCFLLILAAAATLAGCGIALIFHHGRGLQAVLWSASVTMLIACVVGYAAYSPFVGLSEQLANPNVSIESGIYLSYAFASFHFTPLVDILQQPAFQHIYEWTGSIVLLVLVLAWIAARNILRMIRRPPAIAAT